MRIKTFASIAVAVMLAGCTETPKYSGAPVDNDQNVLTGGPITGTTIQDLPQPVKDALKSRTPHAEIASIVKSRSDGRTVYEISFIDMENAPEIYLREDGKVMPEPMRAQK